MCFDVFTENIKKRKEAKIYSHHDYNCLTSVTIHSLILPMQAVFLFYGVVGISLVSLWKTFFTCNVLTENKKDNSPERGWARYYGTWTSLNQSEGIHRGTKYLSKGHSYKCVLES